MHPGTKKCIYKCFSLTHPRSFMEPPKDRGEESQKLLVDNECCDTTAQTGSFILNMFENSISRVGWQVSSSEDVIKEFRDGKKLELRNAGTAVQLYPIILSAVQLYPIILIGGGATKWVSCAICKDSMAGQHCNHHRQRSQEGFIQGLGGPWTIEKIKNAADHFTKSSFYPPLLIWLPNQ
jgi:hypothetical protein